MPKTIRLTKKRERMLANALTIDDILYRKFELLNRDLARRESEFQRRKQVIKVFQRRGPRCQLVLQILATHQTPEGVVVICR